MVVIEQKHSSQFISFDPFNKVTAVFLLDNYRFSSKHIHLQIPILTVTLEQMGQLMWAGT